MIHTKPANETTIPVLDALEGNTDVQLLKEQGHLVLFRNHDNEAQNINISAVILPSYVYVYRSSPAPV